MGLFIINNPVVQILRGMERAKPVMHYFKLVYVNVYTYCTVVFTFTSSLDLFQNGLCHYNDSSLTAHVKSYTNVTSGDLEALKAALYKYGPTAVGIDAAHRSFSFYSNGVYYEPDCSKLFIYTFILYLGHFMEWMPFAFCNSSKLNLFLLLLFLQH